MRIVTVLGTRPEIIRLSRIVPKLDRATDHVLIHTGQNYEPSLSEVFFRELGMREPDISLHIRGETMAQQIGGILTGVERVFLDRRPDRLLVLGDTNSALSSFIAKRMGIPVFHMEAGNRCYDDRAPEEVNRRIIDNSSDILMPYTERSRANLLREGIPGHRIFVTGNPIYEVLQHYRADVAQSRILEQLELEPQKYLLVTLHRAENVDVKDRLANYMTAFNRLADAHRLPVIVSTHPRTRQSIETMAGVVHSKTSDVRYLHPFGLFDFVRLEQGAFCVLTDSGTVQEECAIFGVPNVTLRDVTERPETVECGSNMLTGSSPDFIEQAVSTTLGTAATWRKPAEYLIPNVSDTAVKIVTGYHEGLMSRTGD